MDISVVTNESDWDGLRGEWDTLFESATSASIFLSFEWMRPWWRHYRKPGDSLYILTARKDGNLAGVAPLYIGTAGYGPLTVRRLGLIGDSSEDSEYLDFLMAGGLEKETAGGFLEYLNDATGGWDCADLCLVPAGSTTVGQIVENATRQHHLLDLYNTQCYSMDLPGTWDALLKGLQSRFRGKVRSLLRRIPDESGGVFEKCESKDALPRLLESLFDLHERRWKMKDEPGSFADPARRKFYYEMAEGFLDRGWLRFYSLRLGPRYVAHEFSFEHRGHVYYLQQGFDPDYEKLNVGNALKAWVIRDCVENGSTVYDFLGGAGAFKTKWGATPRDCTYITFGSPSLKCFSYMWTPRLVDYLRDYGRGITPPRVLELKRSFDQWVHKKKK